MWVDQGWHPRSGAFDTLCFAQPQKIQPSTVTGLCREIEYKPSDAPMVGWLCSSSSSTVSIRTLAAASHQLSLFEPVPIQPASLLLTEHVRPLALVRLSFRDLGLFSNLFSGQLGSGVRQDGRAGQRPDLHWILLHCGAVSKKGKHWMIFYRFKQEQKVSKAKS